MCINSGATENRNPLYLYGCTTSLLFDSGTQKHRNPSPLPPAQTQNPQKAESSPPLPIWLCLVLAASAKIKVGNQVFICFRPHSGVKEDMICSFSCEWIQNTGRHIHLRFCLTVTTVNKNLLIASWVSQEKNTKFFIMFCKHISFDHKCWIKSAPPSVKGFERGQTCPVMKRRFLTVQTDVFGKFNPYNNIPAFTQLSKASVTRAHTNGYFSPSFFVWQSVGVVFSSMLASPVCTSPQSSEITRKTRQ